MPSFAISSASTPPTFLLFNFMELASTLIKPVIDFKND